MDLYEVIIHKWKGQELDQGHLIPDLITEGTLKNLKALGQDHRIQARKILSLDQDDPQARMVI